MFIFALDALLTLLMIYIQLHEVGTESAVGIQGRK